jgi:predicted phage baseplate assembly protein
MADPGGCGCEGGTGAAPGGSNPPGQDAIAYRSGTHGTVLRRMLAGLGSRLGRLDPAAADDPAVALLDAWATVADVVTFYQERIANEGFLRTAVERRSVLELARAIGYELRPGAAAMTYLDFRTQAGPASAVLPAGTRVLSVPAQDQLPQPFETGPEFTADSARNEIPLRTRRPQTLGVGRTELYLSGVQTGLRTGDPILVVEAPAKPDDVPAVWEFRVLSSVAPRPATAADAPPATLVTWNEPLTGDYHQPEVYAFDVRAAIFGYNAPDWRSLPAEVRERYRPTKKERKGAVWPKFALPDVAQGTGSAIDLDAVYPAVETGSLLVLRQPNRERLYRVTAAVPSARQDFAISAQTTLVTMSADGLGSFGRREVAVHTASRRLDLAEEPIGDPVTGPELDLARPAPLTRGQQVIVTGMAGDRPWAGPARIEDVQGTRITLAAAVPALIRESVRIAGNVVLATHGETVPDEVLGSGDGTASHQRFVLRKPNLTHLAARTPTGVADSLVIRVDGVEWTEVPSLYPAGPLDRCYVVRIDDDAVATVIFGDGVHGARLPTGQENVRAHYRSGIGPAGEVGAHTLSLLPQRPLGIATVDNPLAASGSSAPETLAEARTNAPLTVLTLDRVVSLSDYEDYARGFAGIAKAHAVTLPGPGSDLVQITVAGAGGAAVPRDPTIDLLLGALDTVRDTAVPVRADSLEQIRFRLGVEVLADPARIAADVREAVRRALIGFYAADRRAFGRPVTPSEVLATAQRVAGVRAARITELRIGLGETAIEPVLVAPDAHWDPDDRTRLVPAGLLLLDTGQPEVREMTT